MLMATLTPTITPTIKASPLPILALAQAPIAQPRVLVLLGFILFLSLLGVGLIVYIQRRILRDRERDTDGGTLFSDLRAMRDRGEISEDEYERTRAVVIARATGKNADEVLADAIRKSGGLIAEPGFDLTGQPLPNPTGTDTDAEPQNPEKNRRPGDAPDNGEDA